MENHSSMDSYRKLLKLAAETKKFYTVPLRDIPKIECFNKYTFSDLDPPSHWKDSEDYVHDDEGYQYHSFKYLGKIPTDVLDGEVSQDDDVLNNLTRVARLRGWINHVQFGIIEFKDASVCRIELGLGRGMTNWVPMWQMVKHLDESDFLRAAKDKHRLNKLKRRSSNRSSSSINSSVNYTIGAPGDQNSGNRVISQSISRNSGSIGNERKTNKF